MGGGDFEAFRPSWPGVRTGRGEAMHGFMPGKSQLWRKDKHQKLDYFQSGQSTGG